MNPAPIGFPKTSEIIMPRQETLPNGQWARITVERAAWLFVPETLGTILIFPNVQPSTDADAYQFASADKTFYFWAVGDWYVKQSSGANVTVIVADGGNPYAPSTSTGGSELINLVKVGGTNQTGIDLGTAFANRSTFTTAQKTVAVPGTAEQLPAQAIPNGKTLVIRAKAANTGTVWIGNSQANAEDHAVAFSLTAGEAVELDITNSNLVWLDAAVAAEGVDMIVET